MDKIDDTTLKNIKNKISEFQKQHKDIIILLVINLKSEITDAPNNCFDYETEFFSLEELNDFINALNQLEVYHDISYGENDFINKVSSGYFMRFKQKYKIVYNTTGSKRIRAHSALIPSICELYNIAYASSDILTTSILENKLYSFATLGYHGFNIPKYWIYHNIHGWIHSRQPSQGIMLIAKPAYECASIGITSDSVSYFNDNFNEYIKNIADTLRQPVIVQEFIRGWEVEVPIFDIGECPFVPSVVGIQIGGHKFLNNKFLPYEAVYSDNYKFYDYGMINPLLAEHIKKIATESYKTMDLLGTVRVDFRISDQNVPYITDYNNSPHLTRFHSCAKSIEYFGLNYLDMFCLIFYKTLHKIISIKK